MDTLTDFFEHLFQTNGFMPRWNCGRWTNVHGWLYLLSDVIIGLCYFAIPIILLRFISKKKDVPFQKIFLLFVLFIVFCGLTHIIDALMFWYPLYRLNAVLLFITAIISAFTVVASYKNLPLALSLKSANQLQKIIDKQTEELLLANQKLKDSESQFKALVNNNPDVITLVDKNLHYKFINDSIGSLYSRKSQDLTGVKVGSIGPDSESTRIFIENVESVFKTGVMIHYEREIATEIKGAVYLSTNIIPLLDKQNNVADVLTITKDVTSVRDNEKKLHDTIDDLNRLSKRLELKRKTLLDFAYIVSHNLRSPTGNLIALIDIYKRTTNGDKRLLITDKIFEVAAQLSNTVHELGEVVNISENKEVQRDQLSFETVLKSQLISVSATILTTHAEVTYNFDACPSIFYPKVYLESIILNLLTNALKYASPERPPSIVFSSYIDFKGLITFTCKDNGIGIDLKKFGSKIFLLHKTFHNNADAKGVGLFITKNQVKSMGGSISVESEPNAGTTFIIHFNEIEV